MVALSDQRRLSPRRVTEGHVEQISIAGGSTPHDTRIQGVLHIDARAAVTEVTVDHEGVLWRDEVTRQITRQLGNAPDGAAVIVHVDSRQPAPWLAHQHVAHLSAVQVHSSCALTITEWVAALKGEQVTQ